MYIVIVGRLYAAVTRLARQNTKSGTTSTVNVLMDGVLIQTSTNSMGTGGTTQVWEQFNTSFLAIPSSTTLEFLKGDPRNVRMQYPFLRL